MGTALGASVAGVDYQSLHFWREAARLLDGKNIVSEVSFERNPQGYDDLWVLYNSPVKNCGQDIKGEYFQFKWHEKQNGSIGYEDMVSSKFIGTKTTSILSNALKYYREAPTPPNHSLYILVTPWGIKSNDPLNKFVENTDGQILLDALFDGKVKSDAAKIRNYWKSALGITSDSDLRSLLKSFRIRTGGTYEDLRRAVSDGLARYDLKELDPEVSSDPYFGLYTRLLRESRTSFDRENFSLLCKREKLFSENSQDFEFKVGIRSFLKNAEDMADVTDSYLDISEFFEGRYIKKFDDWGKKIIPKIKDFLPEKSQKGQRLGLFLSTHLSITFLCGDVIGLKNVCPISIYQRTQEGTYTWKSDDPYDEETTPSLKLEVLGAGQNKSSSDLVVSISISQEALPFVENYLEDEGLNPHSILDFHMETGPSRAALASGKHAYDVAEKICQTIRKHKAKNRLPKDTVVHVFAAVPNAFMVFLGQLRSSIGIVQLYEFDLEGNKSGSYNPSIRLE